jgi:hypothetical protein
MQTGATRDIPLLKGTVRAIISAEIDSLEELPAAGRAFGRRVVDREERLSQVEARLDVLGRHSDASTKADKIAAVLAFAQNKAGGGKVAVTPAEIRGCTGVSRRYAYDLVDAIAEEVAGVRIREGGTVQTASGTERKPKALLVDCERVHDQREAVKQFTTGGEVEEGV